MELSEDIASGGVMEERTVNMGKFDHQVVVITGAGQGAGERLALRFYEAGASVCLLDLNSGNLAAIEAGLQPDPSRFAIYTVDVSDSLQVTSVIREIGKRFGRIDILINNAGVLHKGMIEDSTDEHMKLMVDVNLMGPMYCTRACVPYMKGQGGNIVNVSSVLANFPNTGSGAYGAAKAGVMVLTKVWAAELAPYGIRVNCYAPGVLDTPMAEDVIKNRAESKLCQIPLRRFGKTDDAYDLVSFFCSAEAGYITGQTIGLDGGMWATQTPTAAWKL